MALIDEKGRVFGRLNIIDILAVVLVVVAGVFLIGKVLENRNGGDAPAMNMTYTVKVYHVDEEVYRSLERIALPDQLMAAGELLSGYVTRMEAEAVEGAVFQIVPDEEGEPEVQPLREVYNLTFTIEAYLPNRVISELGTQEVRIGKEHIVKTTNFEFESGVIVDCQWYDET